MSYAVVSVLSGLGLFAVMVAALIAGRRIGQRRLSRDPAAAVDGLGVIDAAVFGLFGLLIAFTFSGAGGRFDERRTLIVEEANAIGTAWLRLDLLPLSAQPALRGTFRDYVDARIATAALMPDETAAAAADARAAVLLADLWRACVAAAQGPGISPAVASLILPALNDMIDITTTRKMASIRHPPHAIWVLFCLLAVVSALLAGQGTARSTRPSLPHLLGFPAVLASVVTLVINLEHPRLGLITLASFDQAIIDVRGTMN